MPAAGTQKLERYDIHRRIAVGGMAEVSLATYHGAHGFEKTVAIKRILPELARDGEFEERFIAEAKLAVRLSHANIVQVFDFGRVGPTLFLVLEYIDGLDLAALLSHHRKRGTKLSMQAAFQIAIEIARGLDFAHQHGVIHRDVSPSNILLSRAGDVKIADFGIAVPDARRYRQPSKQRRIMGKWRYMSPEQTRGDPLDNRSDLFSVAAVMFELFTGDKLFDGGEAEDIIEQIHTMALPSAAERRPGLPPELDDIIASALQRDPEKRPARAAELQRALTQVSYSSSIVATALDVSAAVEEAIAARPRPGAHPARRRSKAAPIALDDGIRAQLGAPSGGTAGGSTAGDNNDANDADDSDNPQHGDDDRVGRHTEAVTAETEDLFPDFEPLDSDSSGRLSNSDGDDAADQRPQTIVRTGVGSDGLKVWELGLNSAPNAAPPPRPKTRPESASDGPPSAKRLSPAQLTAALAAAFIAAAAALWFIGPGASPVIAETADAGVPVVTPPPRADASAPRAVPVTIETQPDGVAVHIDGVEMDARTPGPFELEPGRAHRIELRRAGYLARVIEDFTPSPDGPQKLTARLTLAPIQLHIDSTPARAQVRAGERKLGPTPIERTISGDELASLRDTGLRLDLAGYYPATVSDIPHRPGEPIELSIQLKRRPVRVGEVQIRLDGTWADVYLGDDKKGRAPGTITLPAGRHRLKFQNPYLETKTWYETVRVKANKTSLHHAKRPE